VRVREIKAILNFLMTKSYSPSFSLTISKKHVLNQFWLEKTASSLPKEVLE
jgi:hypothetical protein